MSTEHSLNVFKVGKCSTDVDVINTRITSPRTGISMDGYLVECDLMD